MAVEKTLTFKEALTPVWEKFTPFSRGMFFVFLLTTGRVNGFFDHLNPFKLKRQILARLNGYSTADETLFLNEKIEEIGKQIDPETAADMMKWLYMDGLGIIDKLKGRLNNYNHCIHQLAVNVIPSSFKVVPPAWRYSENTLEGVRERERWIGTLTFDHVWKSLSPEDKARILQDPELQRQLKEMELSIDELVKILQKGQIGLTVLRKILGFRFHALAAKLANAVAKALIGRGLSFQANWIMQKILAEMFGGPIGWGVAVSSVLGMFNRRDWQALAPALCLLCLVKEHELG
jgi:hypothetical protein